MNNQTDYQWQDVRLIVEQALELPENERLAFVQRACNGSISLAESVTALLECDRDGDEFLESPIAVSGRTRRTLDEFDERMIGQRLGNFRLTDLIGYGGMGVVYKAVRSDDLYEQQVAVKLVRFDVDSVESRRRFTYERAALAKLEHPYVTRLLDGGTTESGAPYVVIEYVDGEPIDVYCDQHRLTIEQRLDLFEKICSAVQFAHQNLIIHRDLKPNNILVTTDGTPKLLDFGLSKLLGDKIAPSENQSSANATMPAITLRYASPELIRGENATTASDVYSLGVILFELLSGQPPLEIKSASNFAIARAVCDDPPRTLSESIDTVGQEMIAGLPPTMSSSRDIAAKRRITAQSLSRILRGDLEHIVAKAIQKNPGDRYASVEQFALDLNRLKTGRPVKARPNTIGYRASRFISRNRWPVAAAGSAAILLILMTVGSTIGFRRVSAEKKRADEQARKAGIVSEFLEQTFAVLDPNATAPDDLTARQLIDDAAARLADLEQDDGIRARIGHTVGQAYYRLGAYKEAEFQLETARQRLIRDPGTDMRLRANIDLDLAELYRANGQLEKSELLLVCTLRDVRDRLGDKDRLTARVLHGLGATNLSQSQFESAKENLLEALNVLKDQDEFDAGAIGRLQSTLAIAHRNLGQNDEAEKLLRESITNLRKKFSGNQSDTAVALSNLGNLLRTRGRLSEAQAALEESISIQRQLYHGDHIDLATTLNNLSLVLLMLHRFDEAEPVLRESLAMVRKIIGPQSPQLAIGLSNYSSMLREQGRYVEAEPLLREAIEIRESLFGDADAQLAFMFANLGQLLILLERPDDALVAIERSIAIHREVHGNESIALAKAKSLMAQACHASKDYDRSIVLQLEAIRVLESSGEGAQSDVGTMYYQLAKSYVSTGQYDAARSVLEKSVAISSLTLPDDHIHIARTRSLLGSVYVELGRPERAIEVLRHALEVQEQTAGSAFEVAVTQNRLAAALTAVGQFDEAEQLMRTSLAVLIEKKGQSHALTQRAIKRAVHHFRLLSRELEAAEYERLLSSGESH